MLEGDGLTIALAGNHREIRRILVTGHELAAAHGAFILTAS